MRVLGILTERQEELGLRVVQVKPHIWELRDKDEIINIYVNEAPPKLVQEDGWEYLKRREQSGN
jgi:hypothetical protein